MSYLITASQLNALVPLDAQAQALTDAINASMTYYGIADQPRRVRYFIAQSCFETQNFSLWAENLMYTTAERLCAVWPSRFSMQPMGDKAYAHDYVCNPAKLANLVYANRGGNGPPESGDGYKYRGRGGFHLTFKNNYRAYSRARYGDDRIVQNPDLVAQPQDAMMSAGWFWMSNQLNGLADKDQFTKVTQVINGSDATVPQRLQVLNKVNKIFVW
jgi:putative chitinase